MAEDEKAEEWVTLWFGLVARFIVLLVGCAIAVTRDPSDSNAVYLSIVFVGFGLGLTLDGLGKLVGRRNGGGGK